MSFSDLFRNFRVHPKLLLHPRHVARCYKISTVVPTWIPFFFPHICKSFSSTESFYDQRSLTWQKVFQPLMHQRSESKCILQLFLSLHYPCRCEVWEYLMVMSSTVRNAMIYRLDRLYVLFIARLILRLLIFIGCLSGIGFNWICVYSLYFTGMDCSLPMLLIHRQRHAQK